MLSRSTMSSPDVDSGLTYVKSELQLPEAEFEEGILPLDNTSQQTTCRETESDPDITVKSEMVESEDCSSGEMRYWVVCEGGVLREVKVEPTDWRPDQCGTSMGNENIDQLSNKNSDKVDEPPTRVRTYVCVTCGESFKKSSNLTVHRRIHANDRPYPCVTCGKSFKLLYHLIFHKRCHTSPKLHICVTCGKSFKSQSTRLLIRKECHVCAKSNTCVTCGKWFRNSGQIKFHNKCHTSAKQYICVTCGKSQSTRLSFQKECQDCAKTNTCVTCGKWFRNSGHLNIHKCHTSAKP